MNINLSENQNSAILEGLKKAAAEWQINNKKRIDEAKKKEQAQPHLGCAIVKLAVYMEVHTIDGQTHGQPVVIPFSRNKWDLTGRMAYEKKQLAFQSRGNVSKPHILVDVEAKEEPKEEPNAELDADAIDSMKVDDLRRLAEQNSYPEEQWKDLAKPELKEYIKVQLKLV